MTIGVRAPFPAHDREGIRNTYRVLLTRARLGVVLWVPLGDPGDSTRAPGAPNETAEMLRTAGARPLGEDVLPSQTTLRENAAVVLTGD